jgi:hypothetical protein
VVTAALNRDPPRAIGRHGCRRLGLIEAIDVAQVREQVLPLTKVGTTLKAAAVLVATEAGYCGEWSETKRSQNLRLNMTVAF